MDMEVEELPGREHMDMAPHNEVRQTWLPGCFSLQDAYAEDHCLQPQSLTEFCNYTFMLAEKENWGRRGVTIIKQRTTNCKKTGRHKHPCNLDRTFLE